jgi:predicted GTPase
MTTSNGIRVIIMGAAGRDFHDFNVHWKHDPQVEVVCFTANQIPNIAGRVYPASLAGPRYPRGIPIHPEERLDDLIRDLNVDLVTFAYSDVPYEFLMHQAARAQAAGAGFRLLGPHETMLASVKPVVAVGATRTGCGKSQTSRRIATILRGMGRHVAVVRHPMPYGDLERQRCQRFASYADLEAAACTIEEREEYEPHLKAGSTVFAGVDYECILREAEREADVILWDGGNNDVPFFRPDLNVVVADPHRAGDELRYYPGETNVRMANAVIVNKVDTAYATDVAKVEANVRMLNPHATVIRADSPVTVEEPDQVRGRRVLVIEDGPTLTHGGMRFGAGWVAARALGATVVDPRPYARGSIARVFEQYPQVTDVLPAMGYDATQVAELSATIEAVPCDAVLVATPIDLRRLLHVSRPCTRASYELVEHDRTILPDLLATMLEHFAAHPAAAAARPADAVAQEGLQHAGR